MSVRPHIGGDRLISEGQLIHSTVKRIGQDSKIKDRLPSSWKGEAKYESDLFDEASGHLEGLENNLLEALKIELSEELTEELHQSISKSLQELCEMSLSSK